MKGKNKLVKTFMGVTTLIVLMFGIALSLIDQAQAKFAAHSIQTQTVNGTQVELISASKDGDVLRATICYPHPDGKEILPVDVTLDTNGKLITVDLVGSTTWFAANGRQVNWQAGQTDEKDSFRLAADFLSAGKIVKRCDVFVFKNAAIMSSKLVRLSIGTLAGSYPESTKCANLENGIAKNNLPNEIVSCRDEVGGMKLEMKGSTDAERSKASGDMFDALYGTAHGPWSFVITPEMLTAK